MIDFKLPNTYSVARFTCIRSSIISINRIPIRFSRTVTVNRTEYCANTKTLSRFPHKFSTAMMPFTYNVICIPHWLCYTRFHRICREWREFFMWARNLYKCLHKTAMGKLNKQSTRLLQGTAVGICIFMWLHLEVLVISTIGRNILCTFY